MSTRIVPKEGVRRQASGVRCQASGNRRQASGVRRQGRWESRNILFLIQNQHPVVAFDFSAGGSNSNTPSQLNVHERVDSPFVVLIYHG